MLAIAFLLATVPAGAQWKNLPKDGVPLGPDGKPMKAVIVKLVTGGPQAGRAPDDGVGKIGQFGPAEVTWLGRGETTVATAKTDDKGRFSMKTVRPGKYKLVVGATTRNKQFRMDVTVESSKNSDVNVIKLEAR